MKKIIGIAVLLIAAMMALMLCGAAAQNDETVSEPETQVQCTIEEPAKHDYGKIEIRLGEAGDLFQ